MIFLKIKKLIYCFFFPKLFKSYINFVCPLFELKEIFKYFKHIDYLIDVGSNKGQFSVLFNYYYPKSKIYSFEPQKKYLLIQKKILSKKIVSFFNFCLGEKISYDYLNITAKEDSSSLLDPNIFSDTIYKIIKKVRVRIKTLDEVINFKRDKIYLLKIDVQGYENQVLLGAKKNLKNIKYIIIELSNSEFYKNQSKNNKIIKLLNNYGFKILKIFNKSFLKKNNYQADYLFINRNL